MTRRHKTVLAAVGTVAVVFGSLAVIPSLTASHAPTRPAFAATPTGPEKAAYATVFVAGVQTSAAEMRLTPRPGS